MYTFNINNTKELRKMLRLTYAHDGIIEKLFYKQSENLVVMEFVNMIFKVKSVLTFRDVYAFLTFGVQNNSKKESIISLTLEDDFSYLENILKSTKEIDKNSLYLLFQMLHGSELHIVSKEVTIEITHFT